MKNLNINTSFQLNGKSFSSVEELLVFSEGLSASTHQFLKNLFSEDDFITIQTSGSTGKPKLISVQKEFMINSALATGKFFDLSEKTTALLCLSTEYIAGKMMLVRALVLGWELDVIDSISFPLRGIKKQYDFTAMVPMQLQNSLGDLHKIKKMIVGGGVVSKELENQLQNISTAVFATYGMTETVTHIAVKKLNNFSSLRGGMTKQSVYQALSDIAISQDERKCLVIDAPKVASEKIVTNDVVRLVSKTQFEWLGRYDNVINSGGVKLHPEVIEKKLSKMITQRFFVAGISDVVLGEKLILVIEGKESEINLNRVSSLTKFEIPKDFFFVAQFVETATKKVQRKKTLSLLVKE